VGEITEADLKDRRILGEEGFISIIVVVDSASGKVVAGPEIHARGFAEDEAVFDKVRPRIVDAIRDAANSGSVDTHQLQQVVRRVVGRWVSESFRRRPMIIPLVVEA
jgi:ribonuclease J